MLLSQNSLSLREAILIVALIIKSLLLNNLVYCETKARAIQFRENSSQEYGLLVKPLQQDEPEQQPQYVNLTTANYELISNTNHQGNPTIGREDNKKKIYSDENFQDSYAFFYGIDKHHGKKSLSQLAAMGLTAKLQSSVYTDLLIHHYDYLDELKQSGGPEANQELCLNQLKYFIDRTKQMNVEKVRTKDIDFFRLVDSYGRRPAGMMIGDAVWLGEYDECLRTNLIGLNNERIKTRYCVLSLKINEWNNEVRDTELIALKMGVCLPKSCDSRNYKNKYELVESLTRTATGLHGLDYFNASSLYCLPDDQAPMMIWYYSPKAAITLLGFISWIAFLIYATYKYDSFLSKKTEKDNTSNLVSESGEKIIPERYQEDFRMKMYELLSIKINTAKLFNITNKSSLLQISQDEKESNEQQLDESDNQTGSKQIVDLSNLEGIKVISMIGLILGHVLMCSTMIMRNGRDMAYTTSISWFTANLTPAFAVNSFFCITGILTSYLIFKTKQIENMTRKPVMWIGLIAYRYLRTLPLYLIVVLYLKNVAKFTGSGPLWDYGTSSIGQRRMCEEESILWTLLFGSNFMNPLEHCIPSAWYLSNDFQFFLVTPIFLTALYKNHKFGIKLLIASILTGYVAGIASIYMTDFDNFKPIANFMPHGLKTYITFFEHNYTHPQYRIPAYLIGLLAGFMLYKHEQDKIAFELSKQTQDNTVKLPQGEQSNSVKIIQEDEAKVNKAVCEIDEIPDWPDSFKRFGLSLSALLVFTCCITPLIATRLPFNKFFARCLLSFIMPSYHVLFASAIAIYILLTSTGHGNKTITGLLASPLWKPFARLSLCVVLINIEVINYFVQTTKDTQHINGQVLLLLNLSCILVSYMIAVVVCVLFEAPLRGISNVALSHVLDKSANRPIKAKKE